MTVASILGTLATLIVGSVKVSGLVLEAGIGPVGEPIPVSELPPTPSSRTYKYVGVRDETGQIFMDVPSRWATNVFDNGWHAHGLPPIPEGRVIGPGLNAAPNIDSWRKPGEFATPGVFIGASRKILDTYQPQNILHDVRFKGCTDTGIVPYRNADFTGATVTWSCPRGTLWRVLAATPTETRAYLVYIQFKLVSAADADAYNRILSSFDADLQA